MLPDTLKKALRFYFITDDGAPDLSPLEQVEIAIKAGATLVQYRNKSFSTAFFNETQSIRDLCKCNRVPFVVNDNILLAKSVGADGVHLGQEDEGPLLARRILGDNALVGVSVSNPGELKRTDLSGCDYIGTGPVYATQTKKDAKTAIGLAGLEAVVKQATLPVVAIGGIDENNAAACFDHGATGVAVISCISRAKDPLFNACRLGKVCGCSPREGIDSPWKDEFGLIEKLITAASSHDSTYVKVAPGDDASLLYPLTNPVVTTDTQKEGVHFILDWQTPEEVGSKAVAITLSDLAACYAKPVGLFVNLSLPPYISERFVEALHKGIRNAVDTYGCALAGGNISRAAQLSIDLFAIGQGREDLFPARSAAEPDDGLYCTGPLGLAGAGLQCLMKKDTHFASLIERFKSPSARFDAAGVLAEHRVACVMDVSDGLAGDAGHIARASGVTIEFDLDPKDFDPALISFCEKYRLAPNEAVLAGGEDYELLFTCRPEIFEAVKKAFPDAIQVGRCLPFNGVHLANLPPDIFSFQHGKSV